MEYQPKTSWLKRELARKYGGMGSVNLGEAKRQDTQLKYSQRNPLNSAPYRKLQQEISDDITGYVRSKNKARGTDSSATRVPVK